MLIKHIKQLDAPIHPIRIRRMLHITQDPCILGDFRNREHCMRKDNILRIGLYKPLFKPKD